VLAELGVADWAPDRRSLAAAVRRALELGPPAAPSIGALPEAAEVVLGVARGRRAGAPVAPR
jgi:hypothetical protein